MPTAAAGTSAAAASRRLRIAATALSLLAVVAPPDRVSVRGSPSEEEGMGAGAHEDGRTELDGDGGENGDSSSSSSSSSKGVGGSEATEAIETGTDEAATATVELEREVPREAGHRENEEEEDEKVAAEDEGKTAAEIAVEEKEDHEVPEVAEPSPTQIREHHQQKQQQQKKKEQKRRRFKRDRQQTKHTDSSSRHAYDGSGGGGGGGGGGARRESGGTGGLLETDASKATPIGSGAGSGSGISGGAAAAGAISDLRSTDVRAEMEVQEQVGTEMAERAEECRATGPCVLCDKEDMQLEYCKETGRRQEIRCSAVASESGEAEQNMAGVGGGSIGVLPSSVRYRSCAYAEEDDFRGLFNFSMTMVVLGAVACFGMRRRQAKTGSLYDRRAK